MRVTISRNGLMAEGLGTGLQNHLQRFESASDLTKVRCKTSSALFSFFVHMLMLNKML